MCLRGAAQAPELMIEWSLADSTRLVMGPNQQPAVEYVPSRQSTKTYVGETEWISEIELKFVLDGSQLS